MSFSESICGRLGSAICFLPRPTHTDDIYSVGNVKRRMNQMPTLTQEQFDAQRQPEKRSDREKSREADARASVKPRSEKMNEVDKRISPSECLFCNTDSLDVGDNIEHMHSVHGLYIPEPEQLSDIETFLGYLAFVICEYNECLFCGVEKNSLEAVRTHMKDKGHCMINLDNESELLDFWNVSDDEDSDKENDAENASTKYTGYYISATELRLPSGSIITSRPDTAQRAKPKITRSRVKASQMRIKKDEMKAVTDGSEKDNPKAPDNNRSMRMQPGTDRRVAVRGELGLVGLPEQQKHILMATEVKIKKREHIAKSAQRWAAEKVANKQKFFKVRDTLM